MGVRREMQLLTALQTVVGVPSRPFSQTKQTDASSLSNTRCDRMFVLLLAMTSLGYAARRLRQDSQDSDKTRSPPASALHPLYAFLLYSLIDAK
jgi:hypothetical protein